jgi:hypothetical protein
MDIPVYRCFLPSNHSWSAALAGLHDKENHSSRLAKFRVERRGIGYAEVVQFHSRGYQVVLVDFIALRKSGQRNGRASLFVYVDAAWWVSRSWVTFETKGTQHLF